jgi:hypothetical protein
MYTFDPPNGEPNNLLPEWHEPFPEPQTIPSGWDLSELLPAPSCGCVADATVRADE